MFIYEFFFLLFFSFNLNLLACFFFFVIDHLMIVGDLSRFLLSLTCFCALSGVGLSVISVVSDGLFLHCNLRKHTKMYEEFHEDVNAFAALLENRKRQAKVSKEEESSISVSSAAKQEEGISPRQLADPVCTYASCTVNLNELYPAFLYARSSATDSDSFKNGNSYKKTRRCFVHDQENELYVAWYLRNDLGLSPVKLAELHSFLAASEKEIEKDRPPKMVANVTQIATALPGTVSRFPLSELEEVC